MHKKPSTSSNNSIKSSKAYDTSNIVHISPIEGTNRVVVLNQEFHKGPDNQTHRYWYCKYKRTLPRICRATLR